MSKPMVTRTRREAYEHWLNALETGNYKQTRRQLRGDNRTGFCCLGVLCDLARKDGGQPWDGNRYDGDSGYLSDNIRNFMGIRPREMEALVDLNDNGVTNFKTIAKHIRTNLMPRALAR